MALYTIEDVAETQDSSEFLLAPEWLNKRPRWVWSYGKGAWPSFLLNLVDGTRAISQDTNNEFGPAGTKHGLTGKNTATTNANALNYLATTSVLSGLTELTLIAWFVFDGGDTSAQWMNFRTDNQHTLDVFSQTSTSVTWGADWAGAWNGASQQTTSGLNTGDLVCIAASINQSGARFWVNGVFSGTKSGSGFTTSSSSVQIAASTRAKQFGAAGFAQAFSDGDLQRITKNPWNLFVDSLAWAYYTGTTGVSGDLARTLGNDTLAASGTTTILGTLARTLGNDTLAASGTTTVLGTLSKTLGDDTLAASGTVGSPVSGTLASTLANDTLAASGTTTVLGTLAKTLANDTLAAAGTTTILGTLARTLGDDTLAASGSVGSAVSGTFAGTLGNDTLVSSGTTTVLGSLARTLTNDTLSSNGTTTILGTLARTLGNDTLSASGASGTPPVVTNSWRWLGLVLRHLGF
jgi:hypothetical protein